MFNRIRISTTLFLILILCGILQIGSNGMSFWAFRDDLQRLNQVEAEQSATCGISANSGGNVTGQYRAEQSGHSDGT